MGGELTLQRGQDLDAALPAYPGQPARKREVCVQVSFAAHTTPVHSLEGTVLAHAGDAIVTGIDGETWRVSAARFGQRYHPVPPLPAGQPGSYVSAPNTVIAHCVGQSFSVALDDSGTLLHGRPGDWLVNYDDGTLGVVAADLFNRYYELLP
ncbi:MAG: PGDYG domain-containing protein [Pseudomonadota bacterium]